MWLGPLMAYVAPQLISRSCTSGWFDWVWGDLWLTEDALFRVSRGMTETRRAARQRKRQGGGSTVTDMSAIHVRPDAVDRGARAPGRDLNAQSPGRGNCTDPESLKTLGAVAAAGTATKPDAMISVATSHRRERRTSRAVSTQPEELAEENESKQTKPVLVPDCTAT
jgi:hypothetical protein